MTDVYDEAVRRKAEVEDFRVRAVADGKMYDDAERRATHWKRRAEQRAEELGEAQGRLRAGAVEADRWRRKSNDWQSACNDGAGEALMLRAHIEQLVDRLEDDGEGQLAAALRTIAHDEVPDTDELVGYEERVRAFAQAALGGGGTERDGKPENDPKPDDVPELFACCRCGEVRGIRRSSTIAVCDPCWGRTKEGDVDPGPIGPECFGGTDEGSHYMAQTSAAKLREEAKPRTVPRRTGTQPTGGPSR